MSLKLNVIDVIYYATSLLARHSVCFCTVKSIL